MVRGSVRIAQQAFPQGPLCNDVVGCIGAKHTQQREQYHAHACPPAPSRVSWLESDAEVSADAPHSSKCPISKSWSGLDCDHVVGEQPPGYDVGDAYHHVLMTILVAARAHGLAAIDGPYLKVRDTEAFRAVAGRSAALGYDGKWVLHPDQIAAGNEIFSPAQDEYDRAELILETYAWHTAHGRGAVMLGEEMIDEASRKMALVVAAKGRAAGMTRRGEGFVPPA